LRIKGNYTGGGELWMNGLLRSNSADSIVDFLTIEGNVLGGATQVHFLSTDALGTATTGQGIKVIEALGNANAGDFVQANYVNAGVYRYSLVAGKSNGAFDGSWYLTSKVTTNPPPPSINPPTVISPTSLTVKPPLKDEGIGGEDGGAMAIKAQANKIIINIAAGVLPSLANYLSLTALGTYQDSTAGTDNRQNVKGSWARSYHGSSNVSISKGKFETRGASHDRDIVGLQVGQDFYRDDTDARSRRFGVYVGASHVKSQVDDHILGGNAGKLSLDGYNFGAYRTHQTPEGWFMDRWLPHTVMQKSE
jgi:outer membrane autotransporter protein